MKAWAPAHPGRASVVVLVTDGFPTECPPKEITDIAAIAQTAFQSDPPIRTFVVGFNLGPGGENLKELAKAGGTDHPFLIDSGDIGQQFVDAMLSISSTTLQCDFDIPAAPKGMSFDPDLVKVEYTPNATKVPEEVVKVQNLGACAFNQNQGWYYDIPPPAAPTKILVCPGTCTKFAAGTIDIRLGCAPIEGNTM